MRDPERILSRTEIAEAVWNYDVYNQSNVVDVYIRNLRRKIDDPFEQKLIYIPCAEPAIVCRLKLEIDEAGVSEANEAVQKHCGCDLPCGQRGCY